MRKIRLGRTKVEVPVIGVGTWAYGGAKTVKGRPVGWSGQDDEQATAALRRAYREGLTHWDTADVYGDGHAERLIGGLWGEIPRDGIFLATKVGWDPGPYGHFYHPRQIRRQLEASLANLATEVIDLYYLHHCDFGRDDAYLDDAVELLHRFRDEGKIRFTGLSDWDPGKILRFADRVTPDVLQPYRNVYDDQYAASGLPEWAAEHDVGVVFFSPLKHGLLLGKYDRPPRFEAGDFRRNVPEFQDAELLAHLHRAKAAVEERFASHPQPVLHALTGALVADGDGSCVLLGQRNPRQVAAAATLGQPLSAADAAWVRRLYRRGEQAAGR